MSTLGLLLAVSAAVLTALLVIVAVVLRVQRREVSHQNRVTLITGISLGILLVAAGIVLIALG